MTQKKQIILIFPHQLYWPHPALEKYPESEVHLVEDELFFYDHQYPTKFHKQKLVLHRASMKAYEAKLKAHKFSTFYQDYVQNSLNNSVKNIDQETSIVTTDPTDYVLHKRLHKICETNEIELEILATPNFFNTKGINEQIPKKAKTFMAEFYKAQRTRLDLLMEDGKPSGGKWSFDEENRKKLPKDQIGQNPTLTSIEENQYVKDARAYVETNFSSHYGQAKDFYWPTTHDEAENWLKTFIKERLHTFGPYEDAFEAEENLLYHSALTPMLNIGLLSPKRILEAVMNHHAQKPVKLASLEGFIRQLVGWREFMRMNYENLGTKMRTGNHWNHQNTLPKAFYDGSTSIPPVDNAIKHLLQSGYNHHIERLMVLGNFMFLCEIKPSDIYKWFMEMYVDSYDWVMVPNVYAMSQNADGGLITTKPYFSGSNYIRKQSHYKKEDWCDIWDALYWRWILKNSDALKGNYRWSMMVNLANKKTAEDKDQINTTADKFLKKLFQDE